MGSLKQKCADAIRGARGIGFPIMDEDDLKGRLDRIEAALEVQYGWVMEENESKSTKKKNKKDGSVPIWLSAAIALGMGAFIYSAYAAEQIVTRHIAGEGDDAVCEIEADQGDDAGDSLKLIMGADGTAHVSLGGTERVDITTLGLLSANVIGRKVTTLTTETDTKTVDEGGVFVGVTTGGAIAISLPDASAVPGAIYVFLLLTDGGTNLVVTTASGDTLNATGNNTATFADAEDALTIIAVTGGRWLILVNTGSVALSTV